MLVSNAFKPLSKDDLSEVLGVCPRTLENWVNDGTLPAPAKIGNRVYWHPNTFYAWLDRRLTTDAAAVDAKPDPVPNLQSKTETEKVRSKKQPTNTMSELGKIRSRSQAQLDALMA